jgi:hypothetical protein
MQAYTSALACIVLTNPLHSQCTWVAVLCPASQRVLAPLR